VEENGWKSIWKTCGNGEGTRMGCQRRGYIIMERHADKNKGWACTKEQCTSAQRADRDEDKKSNASETAFGQVYSLHLEEMNK